MLTVGENPETNNPERPVRHINTINVLDLRYTVPPKTEPKHEETLKAGALLCPMCCVEFIEVEVDFDVDGVVLRNVKVLRCPICQEEQFTPKQQEALEERLHNNKP